MNAKMNTKKNTEMNAKKNTESHMKVIVAMKLNHAQSVNSCAEMVKPNAEMRNEQKKTQTHGVNVLKAHAKMELR